MRPILIVFILCIGSHFAMAQAKELTEVQQQELDSVITDCVKKINRNNSIETATTSMQVLERLVRKYDHWSSHYYLLYFKLLVIRNAKNNEVAQNAYNSFMLSFDQVLKKSVTNRQKSELYTLKGFVYLTALSSDPIKHGRELAPKVTGLFEKATSLYPENPRPIYLNALFQQGMSKFFNKKYNLCQDLVLANKYFAMQANGRTNYLYPTWGAEHTANEIFDNCNCQIKESSATEN